MILEDFFQVRGPVTREPVSVLCDLAYFDQRRSRCLDRGSRLKVIDTQTGELAGRTHRLLIDRRLWKYRGRKNAVGIQFPDNAVHYPVGTFAGCNQIGCASSVLPDPRFCRKVLQHN